jgi:hypothetical protein
MDGGILFGTILGASLITAIFLLQLYLGLLRIEKILPTFYLLLVLPFLFQLLVAVGEEVSFRGYILPHIADDIGSSGGILLSSFMFSSIHLPAMLFAGISFTNGTLMLSTLTLAGILLSFLYLKFGILSAISFHFTWNFLQYHAYSMGGIFGGFESPVIVSYLPIDLLSGGICGGSYCGPEASIFGVIVMAGGIVAVRMKMEKRKTNI